MPEETAEHRLAPRLRGLLLDAGIHAHTAPGGQPPTGQPPTGQPPPGQPPTGQPPTGQPPTGQPPTGQPPTGQPPTGQPPPGQQPPTGQHVPAAVLVPLFEQNGELHVVLTRRRPGLRRHAGEISFPGGRFEPGEDPDLLTTALREAEEEVGLPRAEVTVVGALERTSTFVTNYAIHPFVGVFDCERRWELSALEVDAVLEPSLSAIRAGRTRTRMERRGIAFDTDAYLLDADTCLLGTRHADEPDGGDRQLVWGATARILDDLLERIGPLLDRRAIG